MTIDTYMEGLARDGYPFESKNDDPSSFCLAHGWHQGTEHCSACYREFVAHCHDDEC